MAEQTERAFQKQPTIFLNNKLRTLGIGKKAKKDVRYVRNIVLLVKQPTPTVIGTNIPILAIKEIEIVLQAITGTYIDKKCPFTGNVSIRGRILTGVVVKTKMQRTIVIRRDYLHFVKKYR
uniref:40S ribosomal protein S11 N-terminal domain-containing protein n=1 Tax=Parascaris equorum TaxID=6256 RepID=A0A914RYD3_PAREQ